MRAREGQHRGFRAVIERHRHDVVSRQAACTSGAGVDRPETTAPSPADHLGAESASRIDPKPLTAVQRCARWIVHTLREAGAPVPPKHLVDQARVDGFSRTTVYRARSALGDRVRDTARRRSPHNRWTLGE